MHIKLSRPSPALVIACISLFVALGGVGYAAATGSIDDREDKNNSIASKDLKNSSIVGKDVKNSGLTGSDVQANSLSGTDIAESGLGKVPSATAADNAATAGSANTADSAGVANSAFGAVRNGNADLTAAKTTLIEKALPAGSYLIIASTRFFTSTSDSGYDCDLIAEGDTDNKNGDSPNAANNDTRTMMSQVLHTANAPFTAQFRCSEIGGNLTASNTKLTAIQVRSIASNTTFP